MSNVFSISSCSMFIVVQLAQQMLSYCLSYYLTCCRHSALFVLARPSGRFLVSAHFHTSHFSLVPPPSPPSTAALPLQSKPPGLPQPVSLLCWNHVNVLGYVEPIFRFQFLRPLLAGLSRLQYEQQHNTVASFIHSSC